MQIIQSIRERGSVIMVILIVLCLIGFILMDSNKGSGGLFSSNTNVIGKVDGEKIDVNYFTQRVTQLEDQEAARTGRRPSGERVYQLRDQMWNQLVAEKIFLKEADKLGIEFTAKELSAILLSNEPNNPLMQEQGMVDPATGKLDMAKAQEALANIKKLTGEQRAMVNAQIVEPLKLSSIVSKYSGLINASAYYPTWMKEKELNEANHFAVISYVAVPYNEISDSTVKVTDADINAYVKENADLFKQENGRRISYVSFSQLPSAADSAAQKNILANLADDFKADSNTAAFVARNASLVDYTDSYLPKQSIPTSHLDSIIQMGAGNVYGPYQDQGAFIIAKYVGSKPLPDSVRASHILISLTDQSGAQVRDDATAKALADSILGAIKSGADFGTLAQQYSSDGSAANGGDLGTFGFGTMVPEFNEFCFNNTTGSQDVVRTQFGYHVIKITNQKDFKPAYKIAFIAREITPSEETINSASLMATKASGQQTTKELADYCSQNGLSLIQVPMSLGENEYAVGTIRDARQVVKWAFEADLNEVSEPFNVGDQFLVATLTKIEKEGLQDAETARSGAEVIIRNRKKAAIISEKLGKSATLESAAAAYNKQVLTIGQDSTLTMASKMINGLGIESKLIGAAFNPDNQTKATAPIAGTSAVYVMKTNSIQVNPVTTLETINQSANAKVNNLRAQLNNWYEGLRSQVEIKDQRSKVF